MAENSSKESYKVKKCLVKIFCSSIVDNSKHNQDAQRVNELFS